MGTAGGLIGKCLLRQDAGKNKNVRVLLGCSSVRQLRVNSLPREDRRVRMLVALPMQ